jgi:nucleoid-associated protein YgaU
MANEQSKKENKDTKETKGNNENMKEKFPQIIVGVIAVIAIIFGLFYFNNQSEQQGETGEEAASEQDAEAQNGEEGDVGGAQADGEQQPTQTPISEDQKEYTVQEGDTLWSIAERRYGSGYNYTDIIETNDLQNPDDLAKGQKLVLPDVEAKTATEDVQGEQAEADQSESPQAQEGEQQAEPDTQVTQYTVQAGDSLAIISEKVYGTQENWQRIAEANNIMNPDHIAVGMTLMIPRK